MSGSRASGSAPHKTSLDLFFINQINVTPLNKGILDNLKFAVKDVVDIQNEKTSCGNPTWLKHQLPAKEHATCIQLLLAQGATCVGKTILGEFCSGSTGVNHFYGMPPNPNAEDRVPGGSSSGSASVVAEGIVDFSIGTDVAGSIRVPASFCGIYGLRPSFGSLSMKGVVSFAPSFDTLGLFSRDINILHQVFSILSEQQNEMVPDKINNFFIIEELMSIVPTEQKVFLKSYIDESCKMLGIQPTFIKLTDIHQMANDVELGISQVFRKLFCAEIWKTLGNWIKEVDLEFQKTTYVDFSFMENIAKTNLDKERTLLDEYRKALRQFLKPGDIICIPTTPDIAPFRNIEFKKVNEFNYDKLRPLISLSSVGGLPQLTIPLSGSNYPPLGLSFVSGYKQDYFLINIVRKAIELHANAKITNKLRC